MRVPLRSETVAIEQRGVATGAAEVQVVLLRPRRAGPLPAILWLHGGGFIMGSAHDGHALRLAEALDCLVVSVDYRLAPEHPFPAALHDAHAVLAWLRREAASLGADAACIAIGGVSAGGGLAAGLALFERDRGEPPACFLHLLAPMLDCLHDSDSGRYENHPVWNRTTSLNAWEMYLDGGRDAPPPGHASPAHARDLSGLPPCWIGVGSEDLFRDEDADFARRLLAAGVECEFEIFPGLFHGASSLVPEAAVSRRIHGAGVAALRRALWTR